MIQLLNVSEGDFLKHSICYLFGKICCSVESASKIDVTDQNGRTIRWSIVSNHFKVLKKIIILSWCLWGFLINISGCLLTKKYISINKTRKRTNKAFVHLVHGRNDLVLRTSTCTLNVTVFRTGLLSENKERNKIVRVLYITCADSSEITPDTSAEQRLQCLSLNIQLLQAFLSETMVRARGIARKTFSLLSDYEGATGISTSLFYSIQLELVRDSLYLFVVVVVGTDCCCELYQSQMSTSEALALSQRELFLRLANEIRKHHEVFNENHKYVAILSFTRYARRPDGSSLLSGQCAIGSEWLAVYGTPCLHTWSKDIADIELRFGDETRIDEELHYNDSSFRNTNGACYATTLGSLLHEFSHIVDIGHNLDGIMARGFDDLDRFFTIKFKSCDCYDHLQVFKLIRYIFEYSFAVYFHHK